MDVTLPEPTNRTRFQLTSQQTAWVVLLSFFVSFCITCIVSGVGVNWFLFQSRVPLQAVLGVGRGTVGYIESDPFERVIREERRIMTDNENVRTDGQSQATILLRDTRADNRLVAAVTMRRGTSLSLGGAHRPRFEWSTLPYNIDLTSVNGTVDIYIPPALDRDFLLTIQARQGSFVYIMDSGEYTIDASTSQVQVENYAGRALLVLPTQAAHDIPSGQQGTITTQEDGTLGRVVIEPGLTNLLPDSALHHQPPELLHAVDIPPADLVMPWQCGNVQSDPPGDYTISLPDERPAVHLARTSANSHGETFCSITPGPGQTGRDVSQYSYLGIQATFRIDHHSLSACGQLGSECPMMLQIDYVYRDERGVELPGRWFHGFYTDFNPLLDYPHRCDSCILDHEYIYANKWYTYDSGNLFNQIAASQRPIAILRVKFYASGHEYDVHVSDVKLLAR